VHPRVPAIADVIVGADPVIREDRLAYPSRALKPVDEARGAEGSFIQAVLFPADSARP
jgi:hypothetical protein